MKFVAAATTALLAGAAVAAPSAADRRRDAYQRRVARRATKSVGQSHPPIKANSTNIHDTVKLNKGDSFTSYDSNWAGAVYTGSGISKVTATGVNVPTVSVPNGGSSGQYGGAAWVGIDGESCEVILQTGVDWTVSSGQAASYNAWYEWYPEASYDFDITINEGDSISMQVVATSASSGTAYITNESTGQSVSQPFTGQQALCQQNAEWIVEDFEEGSNLVPFAAFSPITFNGASFADGSGSHDTSGSNIVDIQQNSVLTSCSASGSTVSCSYTGN